MRSLQQRRESHVASIVKSVSCIQAPNEDSPDELMALEGRSHLRFAR